MHRVKTSFSLSLSVNLLKLFQMRASLAASSSDLGAHGASVERARGAAPGGTGARDVSRRRPRAPRGLAARGPARPALRPRPARARPARGRSLGRDDARARGGALRARPGVQLRGVRAVRAPGGRSVLRRRPRELDVSVLQRHRPRGRARDPRPAERARLRGLGRARRARRRGVPRHGAELAGELAGEPGRAPQRVGASPGAGRGGPPPARARARRVPGLVARAPGRHVRRAGGHRRDALRGCTKKKKGERKRALARRRHRPLARGRARDARRVRARRLGVRRGGSGKTGETNGETDGSYERVRRGFRAAAAAAARARWSRACARSGRRASGTFCSRRRTAPCSGIEPGASRTRTTSCRACPCA